MPVDERTEIMMAIGNHDENTGTAISDISAALILADKSDVHRDRVVNKNLSTFDIHDRVNYAVTNAELEIDEKEKVIKIQFDDEKIAWYGFTELEQIEHSYAITIHKAQRK